MLNGAAVQTDQGVDLTEHNAEAGPSSLPLSKNAQKKAAKLVRPSLPSSHLARHSDGHPGSPAD